MVVMEAGNYRDVDTENRADGGVGGKLNEGEAALLSC
jgi:hypothetical protein